MTEMFGEAWSPMSVPDLAPDDDDDCMIHWCFENLIKTKMPLDYLEFSLECFKESKRRIYILLALRQKSQMRIML